MDNFEMYMYSNIFLLIVYNINVRIKCKVFKYDDQKCHMIQKDKKTLHTSALS